MKHSHHSGHIFMAILLMVLLAACSSGDQSADAEQDSQLQTQTVYVESPPVYSSEPLPQGLVWLTNNEEPLIASSAAKKGGTFRGYIMGFPLTLRSAGPDSNGAFANYLNSFQSGLVGLHPNTHNWVPELATHWAFADDKVTVYYKLDPNARWSDGVAITADDYVFAFEFFRSEFIVAPFYNEHYTKNVLAVKKHGEHIISITGANVRPANDLLYYYSIAPKARHFHQLDEKWVQDYNWRVEPTAGPYKITKVKKGKYIEFSRIKDWWAKDYRLNKGLYNVDKIRVKVIRNPEIAFKHFLKGELDSYWMTWPNVWHDQAKGEDYDKGYIHKVQFYYDAPQPMQGYHLNQDIELFKDQNVRYGFAHALNVQKVIDVIIRGDYMRQHTVFEGYGKYSNSAIRSREFDLEKADHYFKLAGWSERGPDGIRVKGGQRLSARITYSQDNLTPRLILLKEDLKKAGFELLLDKLDASASFKKMSDKKHEIALVALTASFRPRYWGLFHSDNAHRPNTNNFSNTDNAELDKMIDAYRFGTDEQERIRLAKQIAAKVHEIGAYIPTYSVPFTRYSHWRWMRLPETVGTRSSKHLFPPNDGGLFWIDEAIKAETLAAKKSSQHFEPVEIINETYKKAD